MLTKEQHAAKIHAGGPALVCAGPGTGKTHTLVQRFLELVSQGVPAQNILCLTFTVDAAQEMLKRLVARMPELRGRERSLWVGTYHSLCLRMLRQEAGLGAPRDLKVCSSGQQYMLLKEQGVRWNDEDGNILEIIARWKDALVRPEVALETAVASEDASAIAAAEAYVAYETGKAATSFRDFADLITMVCEGLEKNERLRARLHQQFAHVLEDEYQDVNALQIRFEQLILGPHRNLWAVGDDDQALYSFRGADVRYMVDFRKRYPDAAIYALTVNHRCPGPVIRASNAVIQRNTTRLVKTLKLGGNTTARRLCVRGFTSERREAGWIAARAQKLHEVGVALGQQAVLFRAGHVAGALQMEFSRRQVPFVLRGVPDFWTLPEVRTVIGLLRLAAGGLGDAEGNRLVGEGKRGDGLRELAERWRNRPWPEQALAAGRAVAQRAPMMADSERRSQWRDNAGQAASEAAQVDGLSAFLRHIDLRQEAAAKASEDGVILQTMHGAKGLEYRSVVLAGVESDLLPHARSDDVEEERRVFYVGLTRAIEILACTWSEARGGRPQEPSPFLFEMASGLDLHTLDWPEWDAEEGTVARLRRAWERGQASMREVMAQVQGG